MIYTDKQIAKILAALKAFATNDETRYILAFAMPSKGDTIATDGRILARVHGLTFAEPPVLNPKALKAVGNPNYGLFRPKINAWSDLEKHKLSNSVPNCDQVIPAKDGTEPPVMAELAEFIARKDTMDAAHKALVARVKETKAAWLSATDAEREAASEAYEKANYALSKHEYGTPASLPITIDGKTFNFQPHFITAAVKLFAVASPGEPVLGQLRDNLSPLMLYTSNVTVVIMPMRVA